MEGCFCIRLLSGVDKAMAHEYFKERDHTTKQYILVVEDDEDIGFLVSEVLSQETSFQAVLVTTGQEALESIDSMTPCLLLLDYRLPDMDGIQLYDQLHAKSGLEPIPTIMMSATLPEDALRKRRIIGMKKPFELDDLIHTVEHLLS
jgi:DNA-binding response OmpR family regulator